MTSKKKDFWSSIGNPKYALAPMVDNCDLPFRILTRKYNTQLTYTQMYNVNSLITEELFEKTILNEINENLDYPCFIQFASHDPEILLKSAKYVEKKIPCVDLNLGCPQKIAKNGHYGSFLLDHPDEVYKIIGYLCNNNLQCGISCKIRLFPDLEKTYELCKKLEDLGISCLAVHGRTKKEIKDKIGPCNWDAIKYIKSILNIPIIANGGIETFNDVEKCFNYTKCDCVMSGEKMIENPSFFSGKIYDIDDIAIQYCNLWKNIKYNDINNNLYIIRGHLFKMFYSAMQKEPKFNQMLGNSKTFDDILNVCYLIKDMRKNDPLESKFGWYRRYRDKKSNININENLLDSYNNEDDDIIGDFFQ